MHTRTILSAFAVAAVGASLVSIPSPAQAAQSTYRPALKAINAPTPKAMREANGHLFVSTDDSVLVLSEQGVVEKTLTALPGASGMDVSADDSTVYVALSGSGEIAVVDTEALTVTSTWTAGACITSVAVAGSTLFYSYGCDPGQARLGALSTADGSAQDTGIDDTFSAPPIITAAGATLLTGMKGSSPVSRYDIAGSELTAGTDSVSTENLEDLAASPDGKSVATASGGEYHLVTRSPDDLALTATFDTGPYPTAVAYSHDSKLLAGGLWQPNDDELFVFNRATGAKIISGPVIAPDAGNEIRVMSDTLVFSDDDSLVFALAQGYGSTKTYLVTSTTTAPTSTSMILAVASPKKYGYHVISTVRFGLPGVPVTFTATSDGKTTTHTGTTSASGVATWSWIPRYSGEITASFAGDATHLPVTRTTTYTALSSMEVALHGGYKVVSGVRYYRTAPNVSAIAELHPWVGGRAITVRLYAHSSAGWTNVDTVSLATNPQGRVKVYLQSARPNTFFKIKFSFKGDSRNASSSVDTSTFKVG